MTKLSLFRLAFVPLSLASLSALAQTDDAPAIQKTPTPVIFPDASRFTRVDAPVVKQKQVPAKQVQAPLRGSDQPIEPDWETSFATTDDADVFTVIDANNDGLTWGWNDSYDGSMRSEYSANNGNDDWLVTPPIHFLPGRQYIIKFNIRNAATNWVNSFEVKYGEGDTPAQFTKTLQPTFEPKGDDFETRTYYLTFDEEVTYRFGFHDNTAEANRYWLFLDDLSIEKGPLSTSPAAVEDLEVTPAEQGKLKATVSFMLPTKTIDGKPLSKVDGVIIKRNGVKVATLGAGKPGQTITYEDNDVPSNGYHSYRVTALLDGEEGSKASRSAYIGLDVPLSPEGVKLLDNGNNVLAQWPEARNYGANKGYVDPSQVTVSLFEMIKTTYGMSIGDLVATSDPGVTEMTLPIDPDESQAGDGVTQSIFQLGARADNPAGNSGYYGTHPLIVGPAITLPFKESLSNGHLENGFVWTEGNDIHNSRMNPAGWMLVNDNPSDGDAGSLRWRQYSVDTGFGDRVYDIQVGDEVSMNMPKIALNGAENPKLFFSLYAKKGERARLRILIETPDAEEHELHTYDLSTVTADGWERKELSLAPWADEKFVLIKFRAICDGDPEKTYVGIDDINVFDQKQHNLAAIKLATPKSVTGGKTLEANVTVKNYGAEKASGYSVVLYCNNIPVDTVTASRALGVLESDTLTLSFHAGVNLGENATLKAQVVFDGDMLDTDNTTDEATVRIRRSSYSAVSDLKATAPGDDGTVKLSWSRPSMPQPEVITEDFEDYAAFDPELGEWTLIDGDKGLAGGFFQNYSYPGQNLPLAFFAFNPDMITDAFPVVISNPGLTPKSGAQFAGAPYANSVAGMPIAADNWLITPELSGKAQTIKFYAFNVTVVDEWGNVLPYNEAFDVLSSKTGTKTSDFKFINSYKADGTNAISEEANWKEITVDVEEGTKFLAIHHKSDANNSFLFGIDDVTFEKGVVGAKDQITKYYIYRDAKRVGEVSGTQTTFDDHGVNTGDHVYNVTALYKSDTNEENESSFSNDATLYVNGIAEITANGQQGDQPRYNLAGQRVGKDYRGVVVEQGRKIIIK